MSLRTIVHKNLLLRKSSTLARFSKLQRIKSKGEKKEVKKCLHMLHEIEIETKIKIKK